MKLLIHMGAIAGIANDSLTPDNLPNGFQLADAPFDVPLDNLYWDGSKVAIKPPQPSPEAFWDIGENRWMLPQVVQVVPEADWATLVEKLRGSQVWAKCYLSAQRKNSTSVAFMVLFFALAVTRSVPDLRFALGDLEIQNPSLFTEADKGYLRELLEECHFNPGDFPEFFGTSEIAVDPEEPSEDPVDPEPEA